MKKRRNSNSLKITPARLRLLGFQESAVRSIRTWYVEYYSMTLEIQKNSPGTAKPWLVSIVDRPGYFNSINTMHELTSWLIELGMHIGDKEAKEKMKKRLHETIERLYNG